MCQEVFRLQNLERFCNFSLSRAVSVRQGHSGRVSSRWALLSSCLSLLTGAGCSDQSLNLLCRLSGTIFTPSCSVLGQGGSLCVLPDLGSSDSPTSSSHLHNVHVLLVVSCTPDLEITTVHSFHGYSLSSRFPPGRDSTNLEGTNYPCPHLHPL